MDGDGRGTKMTENETPEPVEELDAPVTTEEETPKPKAKRKPTAPVPELDTEEDDGETEGDTVTEAVEVAPMTLDDIRERAVGLVNNVRNVGVATVMNRSFAALEGFFGGLAGEKEEPKPPRKR